MRTARFSRLALGNGGPRLGAGAPRERCIYARSLRTMEEKPSASSPGQTVVEERAAAGATTSPVSSTPPTAAPTRLFSNLNATTLQHEPGSFLGATALVAGTTVGAGILALPSGACANLPALPGSGTAVRRRIVMYASLNANALPARSGRFLRIRPQLRGPGHVLLCQHRHGSPHRRGLPRHHGEQSDNEQTHSCTAATL